jgi:transcriptional regulator GlxA family with amidase domain
MKHISVLVPNSDAVLSSIVGPYKVFSRVNDILKDRFEDPMFKIQLVGLTDRTQLYEGLFTVQPQVMMKDVHKTDLIIIPAFSGDMQKALQQNASFIPWIIRHYNNGTEVASLCVGLFLLASTGLLNGKKSATHWMAESAFRRMFPEVDLVSDKIITDENGLYTSGGAYSFLNLILYLVEKYAGREMAIICSKIFEIDIDRGSQSPFIMFRGQKEHEDEAIIKAQQFIESNFQEKITVDQLADKLALGRRNLERRFKKATSNTVVEYIQRVKVEAAKLKLESSRLNVNEVMYDVGYTDNKAFRVTFKKFTGLSPVQYRNRYNRVIVSNG